MGNEKLDITAHELKRGGCAVGAMSDDVEQHVRGRGSRRQ